MSQFSYVPGDSRLVDHIIGELKSKGIFDQFRKECIADVDTKPAYQNLRLRVEGSVSGFLTRQTWQPDLNKNQLREKLRRHLVEANYLEQGVERIVDQVVNPKVASVFIPQVEDLVYSYLGIQRPKSTQNSHNAYATSHSEENTNNILSTELEAVSADSVKSQEAHKDEKMGISDVEKVDEKMEVDLIDLKFEKNDFQSPCLEGMKKSEAEDSHITVSDSASHESNDSTSKIKEKNEIKEEEIIISTELSNLSIDIPLPSEPQKVEIQDESTEFKQSDVNDESSSDSTMMRNVSPLTPIRSFNNENSCDAQPPFDERKNTIENTGEKTPADNPIPISTFRFTIETEANVQDTKPTKLASMERSISNQYSDSNLNNYGAPTYDDSSSSNNLHIDYQSDKDAVTVDSKTEDTKTETGIHEQKSKDEEEKKRSHKSSHSSKDRHSSSRHSKDRRSDSKHRSYSDKKDSKSEKKPSKDDSINKSRHSTHNDRSKDKNETDKSKERSDKDRAKDSVEKKDKERADTSKDRYSSSHKISSSSSRESKSKPHASTSSRRHSSSSSKHGDEKKSSSKNDDKKDGKDHRSSSKSSRDHSRQSSSHRSDKDKLKSSSSKDKHDKNIKKDDKKEKKVTDDHYSASGRGNRTRRSTDRDSNDGNSSSSKGSTFTGPGKTATTVGDNKSSSSKTDNQSSNDSTGQSDCVEQCSEVEKVKTVKESVETNKLKPVIKLDNQLKTPVVAAPQLPPVEEVTVRKPMIAENMNEAIKLMKVRKKMAAEQEKKRQEAALLIEFQEKIHSSISQVFSGISGPELEFTCVSKYSNEVKVENTVADIEKNSEVEINAEKKADQNAEVQTELENNPEQNIVIVIETENKIEENKEEKMSKPTIEEENVVIVIQAENDETEDFINETIKETEVTSKVSKCNVTNVADIENTEKSEADTLDDEYLNFMYGHPSKEMDLHYFGQYETFQAKSEIDTFAKIYNGLEKIDCTKKVFLYNCDIFVENVVKQICQEMENHVVINFNKNGNLPKSGPSKLNTQDLVASNELILPTGLTRSQITENLNSEDSLSNSPYMFSPNLSSDCSLDMSSDYEKKIDEMKLTTSRQEVMEIILGGILPDSPSKMPKIVFGEIYVEEEQPKPNLKRKNGTVDGAENNHHKVLMPNKMRKLSLSDQISSTTESVANCSRPVNNFKSKLMGKARQVGLPKPNSTTTTTVPVSPSSDKSVENYVQNDQNEKTSPKLNGTVPKNKVQNIQNQKTTKRAAFQRYDTSDLYKPKLHYLSRKHR